MKRIGNSEFNIQYYEVGAAFNIKVKAFPFGIYYERNFDEYDTRIQLGISVFDFRIGICFDYIGL